jgi:5'-nucleotidase
MGESYLKFSPYELTRTDGEVSEFEASYVGNRALDSTSDTYAYQNGYATITPLKFDWTAHEMLSEIENWGLTVD